MVLRSSSFFRCWVISRSSSTNEYVRQNYFDITGTYYDKDLTDIVYRYDAVYSPKQGDQYSSIRAVPG